MKKSMLFLLMTLCLSVYSAKAQDTTRFRPSGKPEVQIFTNLNNTSADGNSVSKFEVTRAYFGYGYNFNQAFSGRVVLDVANPGTGSLQLTALLKFAYLQYQKNDLTIKFGSIPTTSFDVQEKFWGDRYILKSFQDQYGMNPSADFGVSAAYKFNDIFSADAILENGEGFKVLDSDSVLKAGIGLTIHPVKELTFRGYYDNSTKGSAAQQTTALFAGYANKKFSLGVEYNDQIDYKLKPGQNWSGVSVFGTFLLNTKFDFFARYDNLTSDKVGTANTAWNYAKDGQLIMGGLEFIPVKGIRIAPNYQLWKPRDNAKSNISTFIVNLEIRM